MVETTPGAKLHALRHRPLAPSAVVAGFKRCFKLPLKLAPLHFSPGRPTTRAIQWLRAFLFASSTLGFDESRMHLHSIDITPFWVELNGFLQYLDNLRPYPG